MRFYPYGQEFTPTAANDQKKFGTYMRDSVSGLDYADQRFYNSAQGRFMTVDPFGGSASLDRPGSWNRYTYTDNDPINTNDPTGLCPPGMVEANSDQLASIVNTVESYVGQGLSYSSGTHFQESPSGNLTKIDCSGLVSQAIAGIAYSPGQSFTSAATTFTTSQTAALFNADSAFRVGDIVWFPGHAGIVTGVDADGNVTSFVGSQTSTGPAAVNVTTNRYWARRLAGAKAYKPCVPAQAATPVPAAGAGGPLASGGNGGGGFSWLIASSEAFFQWIRSIPIGDEGVIEK